MSENSLVPYGDRRVLLAGPEGVEIVPADSTALIKWRPPPNISAHAGYRIGMTLLNRLFDKYGFMRTSDRGVMGLGVAMGGYMFDLKIADPRKIAFITARHALVFGGSGTKPKTVVLSEIMKEKYVLQIMGTGEATLPPLFVPLPAQHRDPIRYFLTSALDSLRVISEHLKKEKPMQYRELPDAGKLLADAAKVLLDVPPDYWKDYTDEP